MVKQPWLAVALAAVSVLLGSAQAKDFCPARCSDAGPDTTKWSVYPNFNLIKRCKETLFYSFSLYDLVDDRDSNHRISACSSYGTDFNNMEAQPETARFSAAADTEPVDVIFELGWWEETFGLAASGIISITKELGEYIDKGHADTTDKPVIYYGRAGQASAGVYIDQGLLRQGLGQSALRTFEQNFNNLNVTSPSMAMQLCNEKSLPSHIFGVVVTSDRTFSPI